MLKYTQIRRENMMLARHLDTAYAFHNEVSLHTGKLVVEGTLIVA